jgi:hypothetical protein
MKNTGARFIRLIVTAGTVIIILFGCGVRGAAPSSEGSLRRTRQASAILCELALPGRGLIA